MPLPVTGMWCILQALRCTPHIQSTCNTHAIKQATQPTVRSLAVVMQLHSVRLRILSPPRAMPRSPVLGWSAGMQSITDRASSDVI
jgi:hypothetical protein